MAGIVSKGLQGLSKSDLIVMALAALAAVMIEGAKQICAGLISSAAPQGIGNAIFNAMWN